MPFVVTPTPVSTLCNQYKTKGSSVEIDTDSIKKSGKCEYSNIWVTDENGNKIRRLAIGWTNEATRGTIRPFEERDDMPASLVFRGSSGDLGSAICSVYNELGEKINSAKKAKVITRKKDTWSSIVKNTTNKNGELDEDPWIRLKLGFNKSGKPDFELYELTNVGGNPKRTPVSCTKYNIHEIITTGTITCGFANIDSNCYSAQGISAPAKVTCLMFKRAPSSAPDIADFAGDAMLREMMGDPVSADDDKNEVIDADADEDEDEDEDDVDASEDQLEKLRRLALESNDSTE
jgi:hypothetical protein